MDFKKINLKKILPVFFLGLLLIGLLFWKLFFKIDPPAQDNGSQNPVQSVPQTVNQLAAETINGDDAAIQEELDRGRQQQEQTKDLRIKLEQTNLELEEEKAIAQINKLKREDMGTFHEPSDDGQSNLPEIKVDYIGGDSIHKEAIVSIGGTSYGVKEKSMPLSNIQVVAISDSSVTVHFSAPQNFTKIVEYKPE